MKKIALASLICLALAVPAPTYALFGGGISGPLAVYNTDKTVDAATIATKINTAEQLSAMLKNLQGMDSATAAANIDQINANLQQLANLQNELSGMIMDYSNFQTSWDSQYHDFSDYAGMTGDDYAQNAQNLLSALNQSTYDAMRAQGLIVNNQNTAAMLQQLMQASQSAEGAKAAAQAGNLIAAQQVQQLMQFQQMVAQSNRQQSEWIAYQAHKEAMAKELAARILGLDSE